MMSKASDLVDALLEHRMTKEQVKDSIDFYAEQYRRSVDAIADLEEKRCEKDNTIALLRKKLEESERIQQADRKEKKEKNDACHKVAIFNTALENAWSVQDHQQERIKELELTITSLEMRISNQANYLQAGHKEVDELEETVNRITAERDLARSALDDLKRVTRQAYAERDELKESVRALEHTIVRLEDENQKLHELNVKIDVVNMNLKAENEELEGTREILRCALDAELAKQKPVDYQFLESTRRANYNLTKVNSDLQNRIKQARDILAYAPPPA